MTKPLKIWENELLTQILSDSLQASFKIEELINNSEADISNLPPSILSTQAYYELCIGFQKLYELALNTELVMPMTNIADKNLH